MDPNRKKLTWVCDEYRSDSVEVARYLTKKLTSKQKKAGCEYIIGYGHNGRCSMVGIYLEHPENLLVKQK